MKPANTKHSFNSSSKKTSSILLFISLIIFSPLHLHAEDKLTDISQEESEAKLEKLKSGIKKMTNWLFNASDEKSGLNKDLEQSELKINQLSKKIRSGNSQIKINKTELAKLKLQLKELKAKLKTHRNFLEKQIQVAYFQEEHSKIKLLLNTDNPQDIARQMRYFDFIKNARKEKIDEVLTFLQQIQATEKSIKQKTKNLERKTKQRESSQLELSYTLKNKHELLVKLEKSIKSNTQRLEKMQVDQSRLKSLLDELEASLANIDLPSDSAPFSQQKSKLPWPSHAKVVAEYGSSVAKGKLALNGMRFTTKENDPVTSIYSGRVIFANWIRGFGLLLIIDHGHQFMSLYGNNKNLSKETGDWVRAGETIAISSESTTSPESGLYFEIRKQGKPLNPRKWLR
ncbi:MAG: septal ring factor EnvC (AmiA/AmiB activator) [Oleiphilaceae bacterium]|jgi:septal ring factor EnvC (AmiA/AmiB activator)